MGGFLSIGKSHAKVYVEKDTGVSFADAPASMRPGRNCARWSTSSGRRASTAGSARASRTGCCWSAHPAPRTPTPLAGLESRSLAPAWSRLGALVFRHAEHFYNFQGLRQYKEKFDPQWEVRYLAAPGGFLTLPRVLADVTTLAAGGVRGIVAK
ncbi:MAG TPA: phosphatidylglycerol lysyltransferase domain-containing protein [Rhodocyclaceae bacterium]|nr:phosphatidylglycerol lysyltransferase domain-containing protein [Rhodocyclaceae bacterium]